MFKILSQIQWIRTIFQLTQIRFFYLFPKCFKDSTLGFTVLSPKYSAYLTVRISEYLSYLQTQADHKNQQYQKYV